MSKPSADGEFSCLCYSEAEWKCLCDPDTAYAVTQCFARNYQTLDPADRSNYYQDFLYYTYVSTIHTDWAINVSMLTAMISPLQDCYCGVTNYDVTYNISMNPPEPYIVRLLFC